jgi:hypothetical protein
MAQAPPTDTKTDSALKELEEASSLAHQTARRLQKSTREHNRAMARLADACKAVGIGFQAVSAEGAPVGNHSPVRAKESDE